MTERNARVAVVAVDLFAAVSAIVGAAGLVVGFMGIPLSVLAGTAFADFTVPALLLGIVVGGSALGAAAIAILGPRAFETLASAAAGCVMVGWIVIEVALIGLGSWLQPAYLAVGLVMVVLAALLQRAKAHHTALHGRSHVA